MDIPPFTKFDKALKTIVNIEGTGSQYFIFPTIGSGEDETVLIPKKDFYIQDETDDYIFIKKVINKRAQ